MPHHPPPEVNAWYPLFFAGSNLILSPLNVRSLDVQRAYQPASITIHHLFLSFCFTFARCGESIARKERTLTFVEPQIAQSLPPANLIDRLNRFETSTASKSLAQLLGCHLIFPSQQTRRPRQDHDNFHRLVVIAYNNTTLV